MGRSVIAGVALWVLCAPCVPGRVHTDRPPTHGNTSGVPSAPPGTVAYRTASGEGPVVSPSLAAVIALVRAGRYDAARAAGGQLPAEVRASREARYILARIALETNDPTTTLSLTHGLAVEIPALSVDIGRMEANALARLGRHAEARVAYITVAARGGNDRDRAQAWIEAQAAGDIPAAALGMQSWAEHPPQGVDRARAWRLAAQALEAAGDVPGTVQAWRKLAVDEPDATSAPEALAALVRLGAALSPAQSIERAANLVDRARYAEAIADLRAITGQQGTAETRRLHLLGRAYFGARGRYVEASEALAEAARRTDDPDRDEDGFLSARALARAGRDAEAVQAFDAVARGGHGRWGDEAAYRAATLDADHGRTDAALARLHGFLRDRPEATRRLRVEAAWELGWMLYTAGRWTEAAEELQRSGESAQHHLERGRGRYWAAMARAHGGDSQGAVAGYRALVSDLPLTWYALLAESRLRAAGVTVAPPPAPPARRPCPAVLLSPRVQWLHALGFDHDAGAAMALDEERIRAALPAERADEALALAWLDLGEAHRAFVLSSRHADALDQLPTEDTRWVWDTGFPRPYVDAVEDAENTDRLPRGYLYAIMRQESAFNDREVSSARAVGLLQMIPPTSRRVAQALGIEFREELLDDPGYNIRVGGWYIGRLFQQYLGVLPRAIGAFNAGPGAMGRWVRQSDTSDTDLFVEHIPYDETRTYVRRVVQNLARYTYLYGPRDATWPMRLPLTMDPGVDPVVDY